ncbi:kinase-like protein, partial [Clavulina sp. PMI_390]
ESLTHSLLSHPNILPFLGIYYEEIGSPPLMVLPFLERGSLGNFLAFAKPQIDMENLKRIVLGVCEGLRYLHSQKPPVIHGDLHPDNVLLDDEGSPYLCDFGLGRIRHEVTRSYTMNQERRGGHLRFMAPELISNRTSEQMDELRTSLETDIFSLAMLVFNIWTGSRPMKECWNEWEV